MRTTGLLLATILALTGGAAAQDPLTGAVYSFFNYREPPPPRGGDCGAVAAEIGADAAWLGRFSGKRYQPNDRFVPFYAEGCFADEIDCRVWQQQALTYAFGPIDVTSCRRGVALR